MKDFNDLLKPDVVLGIVLRYRWIIMPPILICILIGIYQGLTLPRVYEAKTLILVEPQRVPGEFVKSVVSSSINERISTISQQILSRSNLERIINDFKLFQDEQHQNMYSEDKIENLRKNIQVNTMNSRSGPDAFSISYRGRDPQMVVKIANTLASFFIDENLRVRESQALGTSDFLANELDTMRGKLESVEAALAKFREEHMGELPEQLQTNLSIATRYQEQLTAKETSLREMEARLADLKKQNATTQDFSLGFDLDTTFDDAFTSSSELEERLAQLRLKYTDKHPDVIRLKKMIENQKNNQDEQANADQTVEEPKSDPVESIELGGNYLQPMIDQLTVETKKTKNQIKELEEKIDVYQTRIENTPKREQEILELQRDYKNIQLAYDSLLKRKLEAEMSVNMERKQKGEQFRIVDTAKLPEKPISPNIQLVFAGALIVGLGIGLGGAVLLAFLDKSFHFENDVEAELQIPVISTIPFIPNRKNMALSRLNNIASIAFVACIAIALSAFTVLYKVGFEKAIVFINSTIG